MSINSEPLKECLLAQLEVMEAIIDRSIPCKGNTSSECQRSAILNALSLLDSIVNSIEDEDLTENPDWDLMNSANKLIRNEKDHIAFQLEATKAFKDISCNIAGKFSN